MKQQEQQQTTQRNPRQQQQKLWGLGSFVEEVHCNINTKFIIGL